MPPGVAVLELAGLPQVDCDGKSQVRVLLGQKATEHNFTVGYFRDSQRMIRTNRWKLIQYPLVNRTQLFDLQNDADEKHDLASLPEHKELKIHLAAQLAEWLSKQHTENAKPSGSTQ